MENILFVIPDNIGKENRYNSKEQHLKTVPYGVLSIASYIEKFANKQVNISILDYNIISYSNDNEMREYLRVSINEFKPDIIGISAMFNSGYSYINDFTRVAFEERRTALVVVGGIVATNSYEFLLKNYEHLFAACFGEGEIPFLHLINAEQKVSLLENNISWVTRKSLSEAIEPQASFVQNLNDIPIINYGLIDINSYGERMNAKTLKKASDNKRGCVLPMHTTRGCPFNCVFCCAAANHGKKVRYMDAERVLSDAKTMAEEYGMRKLSIDDDQFLIDTKRAKKILRGLSELNIDVELASGISVHFIDEEVSFLLKEARVTTVNLAIESGSEYVLEKIIDKPLKINEILPAVKALRKHGLLIHAFFIIGFPGESENDRDATLRLIEEIGFDWNYIYVATPFVGSRLYKICVENNYFNKASSITDATIYNCIIDAPGVDPDYISKKAYLMNLDVNFVKNYRMRIGDYEVAAGYFKSVTEKYPGQAFAHYYLAQAYLKLNESQERITEHMERYSCIIRDSTEWREYAEYFGLVL